MTDDSTQKTLLGAAGSDDTQPGLVRRATSSDPVTTAIAQTLGPDLDDWDDSDLGPSVPMPTGVKHKVGDQIGLFRLVEELGSGGMATVFRAEHIQFGGKVALKLLHPEFTKRLPVVRRFFQEAQAMRRAAHPNIIEITDIVSEVGQPPFILMELLEGTDLGVYLREHAPLPHAQAVGLVVQLCDAVAAVHGTGIVHRDLKPENIFIIDGPQGPQIKLLDFGIAKFLNADDALLKTRAGSILGTAQYMAPEQARGQEIDQRADIYAIGAILYQMLTGSPPFQAEQVIEVLRAQLEETPQGLNERLTSRGHEPRIPSTLEKTVLPCLAKDREERVQTVDELIAKLIARGDSTDVVQLPPVSELADSSQVSSGVFRWPYLALGVFVALALAFVLWWIAA